MDVELLKIGNKKMIIVLDERLPNPRQGCQIFLGTIYQNEKKCTTWARKIYQMAIKHKTKYL
jgi:hypothetical protein